MPEDSGRNYRVGYGRPPAASQFKPGRSGNPGGRRKGAKNFATTIEEELNARIRVTENGRRRRISKRQAIVKNLVNKAAAGDLKAIPPLIALTRPSGARDDAVTPEEPHPSDDQEIIQHILRRLMRVAENSRDDPRPENAAKLPPEPDADEDEDPV